MAKKEYVITQDNGGQATTYIEDYGDFLQSCLTNVEGAAKYTFAEVAALKEKHEGQWRNSNMKVFQVVAALGDEIPLP